MFTRSVRSDIFKLYRLKQSLLAKFCRWQFGAEQAKPATSVKFPGPKQVRAAQEAEAIDNSRVSQEKNSYVVDAYPLH